MQHYPPEFYLTGDDLMFRYDPDLISRCTDHLLPDLVNIFLLSKDFAEASKKIEPWFGTRYAVEDIPQEWQQSWKNVEACPELHLPEPNKFIAEDATLKSHDPNILQNPYPVKVIDDDHGEMFHRPDCTFKQPRAYYYFHFCSPLPLESLKNSVSLDVMVNCLCLLMVEDTYPADLAQLQYSFSVGERGIFLKCSGLNDKLMILIEEIVKNISNFEIRMTDDLLRVVKDQTKKGYYNHFIKPMKLVREARLSAIQDVSWTTVDKHSAVDDITLDDVLRVRRQFFEGIYLQGLVQGNVTVDESRKAMWLIIDRLKMTPIQSPQQVPEFRCKELPLGDRVFQMQGLNSRDGNTVVTNYYQFEAGSIRDHAMLELLLTIMDEPVFDTLRTKEQLGYTVFSTLRNSFGVLGFTVTVCAQASKHDANFIDKRIEAFLRWFLEEKMPNTPDSELNQFLETLIKQKRAADVTLEEEVNRNWEEIIAREYIFDRHQREAILFESEITRDDCLSKLRQFLMGGKLFRKLSVRVLGNAEASDKTADNKTESAEDNPDAHFSWKVLSDGVPPEKLVDDVAQFKSCLKTHPVIHITA